MKRTLFPACWLPHRRRPHGGLDPHCAQGLIPPEEGGSQAKEGRSRGTEIVLTKLFLLPSFSPCPLLSQGTAEPSKK